MRMRELGRGQSVVFCVPDEIHRKIRRLTSDNTDVSNITHTQQVSVADVLTWTINETWQEAKRNTALWANQGNRHEHHSQLWTRARGGGASDSSEQHTLAFGKELANEFLEDEAQLIEKRYRPVPAVNTPSQPDTSTNGEISSTKRQIAQRCLDLGAATGHASSAILQEEQERELAPEVEEERQLERPAKAEPLKHSVHEHVKDFVRTGYFPPSPLWKSTTAIIPVLQSLDKSSAGRFVSRMLQGLSKKRPTTVYCTRDFAAAIKPPPVNYISDSYHRPVQWVLTSSKIDKMLIISPYEAQELIDVINRPESPVALHLYAPLTNEGYRSLDRLDLYTVPASRAAAMPMRMPTNTILELDLFAGQLYFKTYAEFEALREYLLVHAPVSRSGVNGTVKGGDDQPRAMDESLVGLLSVVMMKIRRNCETIDKTHTGKALDSRRITEGEFGKE